MPPPDRRALAYTAAAVSIFGWGSLYPVAKLALEEVTPLMVALARAVLAGLILALLTCLRNGHLRHGLGRLRREATTDWRGPCVLGLISLAGTSLMAMTAQQFLPAAVNGLLNNLSPLWLALYTALTGRARNAPLLLAGSSLAAVGVALVLLGGASPPPPPAASAAAASAAAAPRPQPAALLPRPRPCSRPRRLGLDRFLIPAPVALLGAASPAPPPSPWGPPSPSAGAC